MYQARFNKKGNIKLGDMTIWSWSKLMSNREYETVYGIIKGSCGKYCDSCKHSCYVLHSYRYPSVIKGHARNTQAFRTDLFGSFSDLEKQIIRAKKQPDIIRINQSGEIESPLELLMWVKLAAKYQNIMFYLYTKNIDALRLVINRETITDNVTILISVWHEYGLKEFDEFKQYDFIKAFIYDDKTFDYAAAGLNIETYCHAYDEKGNLNHAVTCEKCKKCFSKTYKTIGCYDH